jgi:predicted nucleic acid-binding protein
VPSRSGSLPGLDEGESEAISLAIERKIDGILIDERKGRRIAKENGLTPVGTLTLLEEAATVGLINFEELLAKLRSTNFRLTESLVLEARERLNSRKL